MRFGLVLLCFCNTLAAHAADASWKLPLAEKAVLIEQNCADRHNILGLYPSQVEVPLDRSPVDNSTLGIGNIAHSVCWTANYLAGAAYIDAYWRARYYALIDENTANAPAQD